MTKAEARTFETDVHLRNLKPGPKPYEVKDVRCRGLRIRVTTAGKAWTFVYFSKSLGKAQRLAIGPYPGVSLADARAAADEARLGNVRREDPRQAEKQRDAETRAESKKNDVADTLTFDVIAKLFVEKYSKGPNPNKPIKKTWRDDTVKLALIARRGNFGPRPFASITAKEIARYLDRMVDKGHKGSAISHHGLLTTLWGWASSARREWPHDPDFSFINVMSSVERPAHLKPKTRVLSPDEIKTVWAALTNADVPIGVSPEMRCILMLILATMRRPGEICALHRDEIATLTGRNPQLVFSEDKQKNGKEFIAPLPDIARDLLVDRIKELPANSDYIFPVQRKSGKVREGRKRAMHAGSISHAAARVIEHLSMKKWTPHDLRRTAATLVRANGANREGVSAYLSHTKSDVTAVYDRHDMLEEKRAVAKILDKSLRQAIGKQQRLRLVA